MIASWGDTTYGLWQGCARYLTLDDEGRRRRGHGRTAERCDGPDRGRVDTGQAGSYLLVPGTSIACMVDGPQSFVICALVNKATLGPREAGTASKSATEMPVSSSSDPAERSQVRSAHLQAVAARSSPCDGNELRPVSATTQ
jgi:hypothetical protein